MYILYIWTQVVFCCVWNMSCEHVKDDTMCLSRGANIYIMLKNSTHIIIERIKSKMSVNSLCSIHIPYTFHMRFVFENLFIKSFFFSSRFQKWRLFGYSNTLSLSNHTLNTTHFTIFVYMAKLSFLGWHSVVSMMWQTFKPPCNYIRKYGKMSYAKGMI